MQVVLVMFRADGERRSFSVTRDVTVIGRREDCDLRIPLSEVSRKHCRFLRDGDGLRIEDLGSSNGTYHNGERVQEAILSPGDTIQVGPVVFCIQIDGVPAEEDMSPVLPAAPAEAANESGVVPALPSDENLSAEETIDEAPEDDLSAFEEVPEADGAVAAVGEVETTEDDLSSLEEPLALEDDEPVSHATPPPLPPALPVAEEEALTLEEDVHGGEEGIEVEGSEDLLEDFEIIEEDDSHASQSGDDLTVDSEKK